MKEKLKNKKVIYTIIGIISVLLVVVGITYAYWLVTRTQEGENVISSGCLDIDLVGENDITLPNQFPLADADGAKLTPYEFKVTNNCNTSVDYQIVLEAMGEESTAISSDALKVALNDNARLFSSYAEVDTTVEGAYESRRLGFSRLSAKGSEGSSDSYSLRIWIDENANISEMNKTFTSKISVTIGQGIELPYEEGTLAYKTISNVEPIESVERNFLQGNFYRYSNTLSNTTNYYWGTNYDFDETTGEYSLSGEVFNASLLQCFNGKKSDGTAIECTYTLLNNSSADYKASRIYNISEFTRNGTNVTITGQQSQSETEFWKIGRGVPIIKTQDDLGNSYAFNGDVTNNYVKLGTWKVNSSRVYDTGPGYTYNSMEECLAGSFSSMCKETIFAKEGDDMYWRIVRINGDGTVRLIYDGTVASPNGESTNSMIAEKVKYDNNYVDYTYNENDVQKNSNIKEILDDWYETNLEGDIGQYIADSIFCNDRSGIDSETDSTYAAASRQLSTPYSSNPTLKCERKEDRYTVNDTTNGNGLLTKPIGLITADEVVFAGAHFSGGNSYLNSSSQYWTMTPYSDTQIYYVFSNLSFGRLTYANNVRPVINIKADVNFNGNGTIDNPYEIVVE